MSRGLDSMVLLELWVLPGVCVCVQFISAVFEHSTWCVLEIYALENVVLYIAVYGLYKPYISSIRNTECSNTAEINCMYVRTYEHVYWY